MSISELPAKNELSEEISKELKKLDMDFAYPTIIYSFIQAVRVVSEQGAVLAFGKITSRENHTVECFRCFDIGTMGIRIPGKKSAPFSMSNDAIVHAFPRCVFSDSSVCFSFMN